MTTNSDQGLTNMIPKISFGMIVLNGKPFIRYNLKSLYPFAHQIIVVEGAAPTAKPFATKDGHSTDNTLNILKDFQKYDDPDKKLTIVTAEDEGHSDGFWIEKDEMSQAYARRATGNYLWQVDVDEFYRSDDMAFIVKMLAEDPFIKAVTFRTLPFWGGIDYVADGIELRNGAADFHRLFAWGPGYKYVTHRPPTVVDQNGVDLRTIRHVTGKELARRGIFLFHYSFVFPFQVRFKLSYYGLMDASLLKSREEWVNNYFDLKKPFLIDDTSILGAPSWLLRYNERHPQMVILLWQDIDEGKVIIQKRRSDDIDALLNSAWYRSATIILPIIWKPISGARRTRAKFKSFVLRHKKIKDIAAYLVAQAGEMKYLPDICRSVFKDLCLSSPYLARWAKRRWSLDERLKATDEKELESARKMQFNSWYPEDLGPKVDWYGKGGWISIIDEPGLEIYRNTKSDGGAYSLTVVAGNFFENYNTFDGKKILSDHLSNLGPNSYIMIYSPHRFAFEGDPGYRWIPVWTELYSLVQQDPDLRVVDFNPGFDRNGFFHFIIERCPGRKNIVRNDSPGPSKQKVYYFYKNVGANLLIGKSALVLSALGLKVLKKKYKNAKEFDFYTQIPDNLTVSGGDVTMGHYGPWITGAKHAGAHTILYGPGDRFRDYRPGEFFRQLQQKGTFKEQYLSSDIAIMQAGGLWRMSDAWKYAGLCRWIDIPVPSTVFPLVKKVFSAPGNRVFCFINLYDDEQKGFDIAREICRLCPEIRFIAIRCPDFGLSNVQQYPFIDNRSKKFRDIVARADFIVSPSRDDAQPGTIAECGSLGLLPIISDYTGYVLSFPRRLDINAPAQCAEVIRGANMAPMDTVRGWQTLYARYIETYHRPAPCEKLLTFYLEEI